MCHWMGTLLENISAPKSTGLSISTKKIEVKYGVSVQIEQTNGVAFVPDAWGECIAGWHLERVNTRSHIQSQHLLMRYWRQSSVCTPACLQMSSKTRRMPANKQSLAQVLWFWAWRLRWPTCANKQAACSPGSTNYDDDDGLWAGAGAYKWHMWQGNINTTLSK